MSPIKVARQPRSIVIITFTVMLALFLCRAWFVPYPAETQAVADMPLGRLIDLFMSWSPIAGYLAGMVTVFINGALLTRLVEKYHISFIPTYMPLIMYLLGAYTIFVPRESLSAAIIALLLIISTDSMIASFRRSFRFSEVFTSAFCLGLIPMIYSPGIVLVLMLPLTLMLYQREARELVVAAVGLVLPLVFCSAGWWIAGREWNYMIASLWDAVTATADTGVPDAFAQTGVAGYVYGLLYAALFLYSVILVLRYFPQLRTRAKKIYIHLFMLAGCTMAMLLLPSCSLITICLMAVPWSLITTVFFIRHKGALSLIVYLILLIYGAAINILPLTAVF